MLRYYPKNKVKTGLSATVGQFYLNNKPYSGKYYSTYDGKYYAGDNPIFGSNEELTLANQYENQEQLNNLNISIRTIDQLATATKVKNNVISSQPNPYYPFPIDSDYQKGYINRYFLKRINDKGFVMEISEQEFSDIRNGTANYDVTFYQTIELFWKITGPLNNKRISQYDTRAGILDTNKRLVETANKTFLGIKDYIGGEYSKFARLT